MTWLDKICIRITAFAVLYPWAKPMARPFAKRLMRRFGDA